MDKMVITESTNKISGTSTKIGGMTDLTTTTVREPTVDKN